MEKINTKGQILDAALELFSKKGFEATSIAEIADAVGLKKASLYSHFTSKQDILDSLTQIAISEYESNSIMSSSRWDDPEFTKGKENLNFEDVKKVIKEHFEYVIHDPDISRMRKLLIIEQFQNEELRKFQSKQSYEDVIRYNTGLLKFLIKNGNLRDDNTEIMAAQFSWPISMWINLCDREPWREEEATALLDKHIDQFFRIYKK